jgi:hypothetical protein
MSLRNLFRRVVPKFARHQHQWVEENYRRHCACGAQQLLMQNRFPQVGEPSLTWMTVDEGREKGANHG